MAATAQDASIPLKDFEGKKDEDYDDELEYSPFYGIEKGLVLQETRVFSEANVDPRRCQQVITKLLYLLTQGESFTKAECSDVFFSVTKLFQHHDPHLRRMVYMCIKEFIPSSDEVIIITSSLMKDANSNIELYRANAIRVLCRIIDSHMLLQIERYLKQAVVDKSPVVASSVLAGAIQLVAASPANAEVIKRWTSEVQEAVQSRHQMVQFHAVALQHALRASDRLAISKLVTQLTRSGIRSPFAQLLLVRYVSQIMAETPPSSGGGPRPFHDYLESCLRNKSELVIFEAARAIANMKDVTTRELTPAITVLQLFMSSSKPVLRFAAVRTLSGIAATHPMAVASCNIDLEGLISDSNRSIATLAITTLLKTGNESSVDRLLKQIGSFMGELQDEFKTVVVKAIQNLCIKFPSKYRGLLGFLAGCLREDGGFEYKKSIVDAILDIIKEIPDSKEVGLVQLAEFIEDCEFTYLSVQILHLLGEEGPHTKEPARYIRFIYNRIILENATVRAAAVSALARFAYDCPELQRRVIVLLRRAALDTDDEVRDRAVLYLTELDTENMAQKKESGAPTSVDPKWQYPAKALESKLLQYLESDETESPFELSSVPIVVPPSPSATKSKGQGLAAAAAGPTKDAALADENALLLKSVPELANIGPVWKTCAPVQLTEEETEYKVVCVHHVLAEHDVFQFHITNTVKEQVLEDVGVAMDLADAPDYEEEFALSLSSAPTDGAGQAYVVLKRLTGGLAMGRFACLLRFRVKEIDPSTGEAEEEGFEDEYQLEDLELTPADYIKSSYVSDFNSEWEELGEEGQAVDSYGLGERDGGLPETVETVIKLLGMNVVDGTDAVPPNARSHTVHLAGKLVGDIQVLLKLQFGLDAERNVAMKMAVRSESLEASEAVHVIIQEA